MLHDEVNFIMKYVSQKLLEAAFFFGSNVRRVGYNTDFV